MGASGAPRAGARFPASSSFMAAAPPAASRPLAAAAAPSAAPSPSPASRPQPSEPRFQVISLNDANPQIREYKRRKPHKKTKNGCIACKQKRVKCDETFPVCLRCQRNRRTCVYPHDGTSPPTHIVTKIEEEAAGDPRMSLSTAIVPAAGPEVGTSSDELLLHYRNNWFGIFDMPSHTGSFVPLALRYPHLRSTLLAISASHLRHQAPGHKEYRVAEQYQVTLAVRDYQAALDTPFDVHGQMGTDSLLLTAMLMNTLSMVLPFDEDPDFSKEPDIDKSWVFSSRPDRLGWLAVQQGLSPLLAATAKWRERSFLAPLFRNSDDSRRTLTGEGHALDRVPEHWIAAAQLNTEVSSPTSDPNASFADVNFREPIRVMAELRLLEPSRINMLRYWQFVGTLTPAFRQCLFDRDPVALWVFGYWLGLMCRFKRVWWMQRRTRRDFRAIRSWLVQARLANRPGEQGRLWRSLMADLDRTWGFEYDRTMADRSGFSPSQAASKSVLVKRQRTPS